MRKVILASSSAPRKELMDKLLIPYVIEPSNYEEDMAQDLTPRDLAITLAYGKAADVAGRHQGEDAVVIGADSFIVFEGDKIGKPHTEEAAKKLLRRLSGKTNVAITGFVLLDCLNGNEINDYSTVTVTFCELTDAQIDKYVDSGQPLNKGGGYSIMDFGSTLVEKVEGDYFAAIGLPMAKLANNLRELGVDV